MNNLLECKWIETVMASLKVLTAFVYPCREGGCVALPTQTVVSRTSKNLARDFDWRNFQLPNSAAHSLLAVTPIYIVPLQDVMIRNVTPALKAEWLSCS